LIKTDIPADEYMIVCQLGIHCPREKAATPFRHIK